MSESSEYPLVTFALFAYNQERYIREAVESALAQDYPNLEIIISDDCSSDRTFEIIVGVISFYSGTHKILLRRNSENLGLARHINLVFSLARGDLVVFAAGDDVSVSSRVSKLVDCWVGANSGKVSIFSAMDRIDGAGNTVGERYESGRNWASVRPLDLLKRNIGVFGASHACHKSLLCEFPDIMARVVNEDHVIPFRASLMDGILYVPESLVKYRAGIGLASNYRRAEKIREKMAPSILIRPYLVTVQKCIDCIHCKRFDLASVARFRRADYLFRYRVFSGRGMTFRSLIYYLRRGSFLFYARSLIYLIASKIGI